MTAADALGDLGEIGEALASCLGAPLQAGRDDAVGSLGEGVVAELAGLGAEFLGELAEQREVAVDFDVLKWSMRSPSWTAKSPTRSSSPGSRRS